MNKSTRPGFVRSPCASVQIGKDNQASKAGAADTHCPYRTAKPIILGHQLCESIEEQPGEGDGKPLLIRVQPAKLHC